jgi:hypothetical protein
VRTSCHAPRRSLGANVLGRENRAVPDAINIHFAAKFGYHLCASSVAAAPQLQCSEESRRARPRVLSIGHRQAGCAMQVVPQFGNELDVDGAVETI